MACVEEIYFNFMFIWLMSGFITGLVDKIVKIRNRSREVY